MPNTATSPSFPNGAGPLRSEAEVRTIRARRARLEADLLDEGASEATVARLATDQTAERMVAYEKRTVDFISSLFGPR